MIKAQARYNNTPEPPKTPKAMKPMRIKVGSTLKYSPIPPQTPKIVLLRLLLHNLLFICLNPPNV